MTSEAYLDHQPRHRGETLSLKRRLTGAAKAARLGVAASFQSINPFEHVEAHPLQRAKKMASEAKTVLPDKDIVPGFIGLVAVAGLIGGVMVHGKSSAPADSEHLTPPAYVHLRATADSESLNGVIEDLERPSMGRHMADKVASGLLAVGGASAFTPHHGWQPVKYTDVDELYQGQHVRIDQDDLRQIAQRVRQEAQEAKQPQY